MWTGLPRDTRIEGDSPSDAGGGGEKEEEEGARRQVMYPTEPGLPLLPFNSFSRPERRRDGEKGNEVAGIEAGEPSSGSSFTLTLEEELPQQQEGAFLSLSLLAKARFR